MTKRSYEGFCPIRNILDRIGDKWSMLTLLTLNSNGVMRFGELGRAIPDVSQKMLTTTLRTLEADGYVSRTVYAEIPPRVEYRLTELGATLIPLLDQLVGWALEHKAVVLANRNGCCNEVA